MLLEIKNVSTAFKVEGQFYNALDDVCLEVNENEDKLNKEYELSNENNNKFVIDNKEPRQIFDELKKESLNI